MLPAEQVAKSLGVESIDKTQFLDPKRPVAFLFTHSRRRIGLGERYQTRGQLPPVRYKHQRYYLDGDVVEGAIEGSSIDARAVRISKSDAFRRSGSDGKGFG